MSSPTVFVCGATGTQGGALTHELLKRGVKVHAITRTLDSSIAQQLRANGVSLIQGNFDDEESLRISMSHCTTLFLNLRPDVTNMAGELEQAKRVISIAKQVGIQHIVYTSSMGTKNPQSLRHWNPQSLVGMIVLSKQSIENEIRNAGFQTWTILRPGNFMTNFLSPLVQMYPGLAETGQFTTAFTPETVLPMVDPMDIGKFATAAILQPAEFNKEEIEIASQMMKLEQVMQDLSHATGKGKHALFLSEEEVEVQESRNPLVSAQKVMRDISQFVDMEKAKSWNIGLQSFSQFLDREQKRVRETYV